VSQTAKRIFAGIVLTVIPFLVVFSVKASAWGKFAATPKARQLGEVSAKVVLVEYSDFQCPMCAQVQPALHEFLTLYKGKVRLAYKYFPLTRIHQNAIPAAHAAECAGAQDKFWPYQDALFQTQREWAPLADATTNYLAIAAKVQLDIDKFKACQADPAINRIVEADRQEGESRQIAATPTLFVNDERLVGSFIQTDGARTIEKELRK
jgi:protein-disulfide isomerase